MFTSDQKGAHEAVKLGIEVYKPVMDGSRCDFILADADCRLIRAQCKWARRVGDVIAVRCYSSRRSASGFVKRPYTPSEVDALVAYCPELDRCYYLPLENFPGRVQIQLRLARAKNNQRSGIHWAEDYELAARLCRPGAVAQLGERVTGSHEVRGSIPLGSIDSSA